MRAAVCQLRIASITPLPVPPRQCVRDTLGKQECQDSLTYCSDEPTCNDLLRGRLLDRLVRRVDYRLI